MKKNYFFGLCAATMLLTTSCQQENIFTEMWGEKEQTVTLNVTLPEMGTATRAYGEGKNAKYLKYAVYSLNAQEALSKLITLTNEEMEGETPTEEISLKLVPGNKYSIVLWADAYGQNGANSPFTVTMGTAANTMTIDKTKVKTNDDMTDAFFGSFVIETKPNVTDGYVITEYGKDVNVGKTLKLKRPFAQLNIAATNTDLDLAQKSNFTITQTSVTVKNVSNTLDLRTGEVLGTAVETEYAINNIPEGWDKTKYTTHTLLAMNYILMTASKQVVPEVKFEYFGTTSDQKGERTYYNVPLRRNWRTNIYGDLFTEEVGITVTIDPNFVDQTQEDDEDNLPTHDSDNNDMYDVDGTVKKDNTTTTNP